MRVFLTSQRDDVTFCCTAAMAQSPPLSHERRHLSRAGNQGTAPGRSLGSNEVLAEASSCALTHRPS